MSEGAAPVAQPADSPPSCFRTSNILGFSDDRRDELRRRRRRLSAQQLVAKNKWIDDAEFLELMSISNTLPGLNATNMSILAGDRLRGTLGAIAAMLGMCLPGLRAS